MKLHNIIQISSAAMIAMAMPAMAQDLQSVSQSKDWTVYVDQTNPKHCYVASAPTATKATRGGQDVTSSVSRGPIQLYVCIKNGATEPSFKSGYPLAADRAVDVQIGGSSYNYLTNPNVDSGYSWPQPKFDQEIINSMKAGTEVQVTAVSSKGTTTIDKFSLSGFTAAYNASEERCK